jgi:hypothetical protein
MGDMLARASNWLDSTLSANASQTVRYRRGASYADVSATFGIMANVATSTQQVQRSSEQVDFMILSSALILSGNQAEPQTGDAIEFDDVTYEVLPDQISGLCFSYCDDSTKGMLRIHTKEVG